MQAGCTQRYESGHPQGINAVIIAMRNAFLLEQASCRKLVRVSYSTEPLRYTSPSWIPTGQHICIWGEWGWSTSARSWVKCKLTWFSTLRQKVYNVNTSDQTTFKVPYLQNTFFIPYTAACSLHWLAVPYTSWLYTILLHAHYTSCLFTTMAAWSLNWLPTH